MGFGQRVVAAFRAFFSLLSSGTLPDDLAETLREAAPGSAVDVSSVERPPVAAAAAPAPPVERAADGAVQIIALLQRDARLLDFLMEDLAGYPDAQIGAAAREVHAGARRTLQQYLEIEPVLDGAEDQPVSLPSVNADEVKLVGRVVVGRPGARHAQAPRLAQRPGAAAGAPARVGAPDHRTRRSRGRVSRGAPSSASISAPPTARSRRWTPRGDDASAVRTAPIPQLVNPGRGRRAPAAAVVPVPAGRARLSRRAASRCRGELAPTARWSGELARKRGAENPARLVASAKSWLSHAGANRTAPILPWGAPGGRAEAVAGGRRRRATWRTSRDAWNARVARRRRCARAQDVLLTVPASFDEEARELTLARGRDGGPRPT